MARTMTSWLTIVKSITSPMKISGAWGTTLRSRGTCWALRQVRRRTDQVRCLSLVDSPQPVGRIHRVTIRVSHLVWAGNDSTSADSWNGNTVADVVGNVQSQFLYGITYVTDGADQDHSNIMNNYLDGQDSSHARNGIDIMASQPGAALHCGQRLGDQSGGFTLDLWLRSVEHLRDLQYYQLQHAKRRTSFNAVRDANDHHVVRVRRDGTHCGMEQRDQQQRRGHSLCG